MTDEMPPGVQGYVPPLSAWRENNVLIFGVALFSILLVLLGWLGWRLQPDGLQTAHFVFFGLLLLVVLFALLREWRHRYRNRQQCALQADDEGLWPAHLERDAALVRWADIDDAQYEVNTTHSGLTLLGRHQALLRIDCRLSGYAELCERVFANMQRPLPELPQLYRAGWRWVWNSLLAGIFILGFCFFSSTKDLVLPLLIAASLMCSAYGDPISLNIDQYGLTLRRCFRKAVQYRWDEIEKVSLEAGQGANVTVKLALKSGKAMLLLRLPGDKPGGPVPCIDLYRLLHHQLAQRG